MDLNNLPKDIEGPLISSPANKKTVASSFKLRPKSETKSPFRKIRVRDIEGLSMGDNTPSGVNECDYPLSLVPSPPRVLKSSSFFEVSTLEKDFSYLDATLSPVKQIPAEVLIEQQQILDSIEEEKAKHNNGWFLVGKPAAKPSVKFSAAVHDSKPATKPSVKFSAAVHDSKPAVKPSVKFSAAVHDSKPAAKPSVKFSAAVHDSKPAVKPSVKLSAVKTVDGAKEAKLDSAEAVGQDVNATVNAKTTHPFFSRFCVTIGNGSACPPPMASLKTSKQKGKGLCKKDDCEKKRSKHPDNKGYCNDHRERLLCLQEGCSKFAYISLVKALQPKEQFCSNHLDRSKRLHCAEKNCENLASSSDLRCHKHSMVQSTTVAVCNEENCNELGKHKGGYCYRHLLLEECQYDGCENKRIGKRKQYCSDHCRKCSEDDCNTRAFKDGLCMKHTDRRKKPTCIEDGCNNISLHSDGKCKTHTTANLRTCLVESCNNYGSYKGGHCCKHKSTTICAYDDCETMAWKLSKFCGSHQRKCAENGCETNAYTGIYGGYCKKHSNRCDQPCCNAFGDRSGLHGSYVHPNNGRPMCRFAAMTLVNDVAESKGFIEAETLCKTIGLKQPPKVRQEHYLMFHLLKYCSNLRQYDAAVFDGSLSKFSDKQKQLSDKRPDFFTIYRSKSNASNIYAIHIEYDETDSHEQDCDRLREIHSQAGMMGSVFVIRICGQHNRLNTLFDTKLFTAHKEYTLTVRGHAVLEKVIKYIESILVLIHEDKSPTELNFIRKFNY